MTCALRYLEPEVYKELEEKIALTSDARETFIDDIIAEIKTHMENAEIKCEVERPGEALLQYL